ncbi:hypothetical protein HY500_02430 [Candidatus Woesearchaeota archaeon]|nr:hypothetical protein [Candidatus Woesearchaeota archaeon]
MKKALKTESKKKTKRFLKLPSAPRPIKIPIAPSPHRKKIPERLRVKVPKTKHTPTFHKTKSVQIHKKLLKRTPKKRKHISIPSPFEVIMQKPHGKEGFFSRLKSFENKEARKVNVLAKEVEKQLEEDKKEIINSIKQNVKELSTSVKGIKHKEKIQTFTKKGRAPILIKPSSVYEVHIIEDLPDPYQIEISRAARRNKVLKRLIAEEERIKKKMSQLEDTELVYYRM